MRRARKDVAYETADIFATTIRETVHRSCRRDRIADTSILKDVSNTGRSVDDPKVSQVAPFSRMSVTHHAIRIPFSSAESRTGSTSCEDHDSSRKLFAIDDKREIKSISRTLCNLYFENEFSNK